MKHTSCSTTEIPVSCVITKMYLTLILYLLWQVAATSLEHGQVERMSMMHRDFRVVVVVVALCDQACNLKRVW